MKQSRPEPLGLRELLPQDFSCDPFGWQGYSSSINELGLCDLSVVNTSFTEHV